MVLTDFQNIETSAFIKFRLNYLTRYFSPLKCLFLSHDIMDKITSSLETEDQHQKKKSSNFPVCEHKYLVGTKV